MKKIASNIKVLRDLKNLSQEALAMDLDITRARLGAYEESRNEPPIELIVKLADYFHISIDALLRADLRKSNPEQLLKVGENRLLLPIVVDTENNDLIEVITQKASAGYLNGYADPEYFERLPLMNLPFKVTGKHRTFPIQGDSMPPLKEGAYVVGKFVEALRDVRNGNTYVLLTKSEGIVYKRVYILDAETIALHSDNKNYPPYTVKMAEVLELWEFVCCLNISDKTEEEISLSSVMQMLRSLQVEIESIKKR
jgi:transcriptional regulator with XRE-family HTH domain